MLTSLDTAPTTAAEARAHFGLARASTGGTKPRYFARLMSVRPEGAPTSCSDKGPACEV
jgi:hypothetical protein